jgi:hypothetical protein
MIRSGGEMRKAALFLIALCATVPVFSQGIPCPDRNYPEAIESIRLVNNEYYFMSALFLQPGPGLEDHVMAEFAISDTWLRNIRQINLVVSFVGGYLVDDVAHIILHTYIGDGVVDATDFLAGSYHSALPANCQGLVGEICFDVTSAVFNIMGPGVTHAGFRMSCIYDHYELLDVCLCLDDGTPVKSMSWGRIKDLER